MKAIKVLCLIAVLAVSGCAEWLASGDCKIGGVTGDGTVCMQAYQSPAERMKLPSDDYFR